MANGGSGEGEDDDGAIRVRSNLPAVRLSEEQSLRHEKSHIPRQ